MCIFLLILNNEKISKKFWAMAAHQKFNSLISIFLITLNNPLKKNIICAAKLVWHIFAASILLQMCQAGKKRQKYLNKGGKDVSQSLLPPMFPFLGPLEATNLGEWGQKLKFKCAVTWQYFFQIFKQHLEQVKPRL